MSLWHLTVFRCVSRYVLWPLYRYELYHEAPVSLHPYKKSWLRSKFKVALWVHHHIWLTPLSFHVNWPCIPGIRLFKNLALKMQGQGHSSRSYSGQGFRKSFSAWGLNFKQFSAGFDFEIVGHNYKDFINKNKHVQHRCTSALKLWQSNQKEMTNMKHMVYILTKKSFFFFKSKYIFVAFNTNQMFPEWLLSAFG